MQHSVRDKKEKRQAKWQHDEKSAKNTSEIAKEIQAKQWRKLWEIQCYATLDKENV